MNATELKQKSVSDLNKELVESLREQFNLRMLQGSGQLSKPHQLRAVRRDIARIKTVLREKAGK